jgi:MraZ protein
MVYNWVKVARSGAKWWKNGAKSSPVWFCKATIGLPVSRKFRERRNRGMLTGEYKHALDPKKRLFIPAKHREELGPSFIIVRDIRESCLKVHSLESWQAFVAPIQNMPRAQSEKILRFLYRDAVTAEPDSQGRVVLNTTLIEHAKILKDAVVVGCGTYAEIWSAEEYDRVIGGEDADELRDALEALGL